MSTPQNPGGDTPQDPQNPYGGPPVPPPNDPAAPVTPPPPATPPPAAPSPPAYGEPAAPADPAATPPPAYGQPAYGQPAYPQPGVAGQPAFPQYGAPAGSGEPSKGMAITALILSFFGLCIIGALVAIPLAIIVLVRGRDGRNHGKGLAIAAIVISLLTVAASVIGIVTLGLYASQFESVNDLGSGQCIVAKGLTDEDAESVSEIKKVSCSSNHDGEVLATVELTAATAKNYDETDSAVICGPAIDTAGKAALLTEDISVTALTVADPAKGDNVACIAYHVDGSKLTAKLGS